jgi:hypothetical protein
MKQLIAAFLLSLGFEEFNHHFGDLIDSTFLATAQLPGQNFD